MNKDIYKWKFWNGKPISELPIERLKERENTLKVRLSMASRKSTLESLKIKLAIVEEAIALKGSDPENVDKLAEKDKRKKRCFEKISSSVRARLDEMEKDISDKFSWKGLGSKSMERQARIWRSKDISELSTEFLEELLKGFKERLATLDSRTQKALNLRIRIAVFEEELESRNSASAES